MADCKQILRQLMADAIDAQEILNDIASNPAFEPEDRAQVEDILRALADSLLAASNWLKRADAPEAVDVASLNPGARVLVDFNGDLIPCVVEKVTDDNMAVVRDELNGNSYIVDAAQIRPYQQD